MASTSNGKKIDEVNKNILRKLRDGRKSYSAIADELGITENTVRARVNKLIDEGVLKITGEVNTECIQGLDVVIMGVKLKSMDLQQKAKEFLNLKGVISVCVVTGRFDLLVTIEFGEEENLSLLQFFSNELVKIKDVAEVESFVCYKTFNFYVPFVL